jgi:hypothetical protein
MRAAGLVPSVGVLALLVALAACGRFSDEPFVSATDGGASTDAATVDDALDAASVADASLDTSSPDSADGSDEVPCVLVVTGDFSTSGACAVTNGVHGPHGYDPARFSINMLDVPENKFLLSDYAAGYLQPIRSELTSDSVYISWKGTIANSWAVSGDAPVGEQPPSNKVGSFKLTTKATEVSTQRYVLHGTLDATLVGGSSTIKLHATF